MAISAGSLRRESGPNGGHHRVQAQGARLDWLASLGRPRPRYARAQPEMDEIAVQQVLEVVADFDESGGASSGLVAWELFVDEQRVADAWTQAQAEGLLRPAAHDDVNDEQMWRLTAGGWAARQDSGRRA
jgi:hypothetical protein